MHAKFNGDKGRIHPNFGGKGPKFKNLFIFFFNVQMIGRFGWFLRMERGRDRMVIRMCELGCLSFQVVSFLLFFRLFLLAFGFGLFKPIFLFMIFCSNLMIFRSRSASKDYSYHFIYFFYH